MEARPPELPGCTLVLHLRFARGVYVIDSVSLSGDGADALVTAEALRQVPLHTVAREAVLTGLMASGNIEIVLGVDGKPSLLEDDPRFRGMVGVAYLYRLARLLGEGPTKYVGEVLGISRATAARRVAEARASGHLGEHEVGQAGGAPSRWGG